MMGKLLSNSKIVLTVACTVFFMPIHSITDSPSFMINLLEDEELVLKCTAAGLGLHLWYKDSKPIATSSSNMFVLEVGTPIFSRSEQNFFTAMKLTVRHSKTIHTGTYKCSSGGSYTQNVTVFSSAILLGDHSVIYDGQTIVTEGEAFQISCELPIRDPPLWTINSTVPILEENNLGYRLSEGDEGSFRRELVLHVNYAQVYQEGEYRCNRNSRDFHYVKVIPALGDEHDEAEDDDEDVEPSARPPFEFLMEINKTYEFACLTAKDEGTPVTWYRNGVRIVDGPDSNLEISGRVLEIIKAQEDDAGEYMCIVEPRFDEGYLGEGRIFRINSPTKIVELPDLVNIVQGERLELQCRTQGYPEPKITWLLGNLNATELKKKDNRISLHSVTRSTSTLIIRDMTILDRGLITCRAENTIDANFPQIDEESVFVHVRAVSSIDYSSASTTYVKKGGKFTLTCQVAGLGVHLWYKDGKPISPNAINKFHLEQDSPKYLPEERQYFTQMYLTVADADSVHTGEYKCNADGLYPQNVIVVTENMIETNEDYPGMGKILVPGETLVLACNTTECPHCTVVWFKDGELLSKGDHLEMFDNNTIVIANPTFNDSGIYICKINREVLDVDLQATIVVQSKINLKKFDPSSVVVEGSPLELYCQAEGGPMPQIKWYLGDEEIEDDDPRIRILDHEGLKNGKLLIEEADYPDRNHYTCEAYNQMDSVNTTIFIRIKDKLAALWPFLGICVEVAILCTIIFVYERRKSMTTCDEPETDLPAENKPHRDQKAKGQDVRQRK